MAEDADREDVEPDKRAGRSEPTSSEHSVDMDLSDEEANERREKRQQGDYDVEDMQNDELQEHIERAREKKKQQQGEREPKDRPDKPSDEEFDAGAQQVRVNEGESPLDAVANAAEQEELETKEFDSRGDDAGSADEDAEDGGVMDGVDDEDIDEAMDMDLNVREDIDPEHFNYEDQDFSNFGGYGDSVTIEYNDTLFLFEQPDDAEQERLINDMQGGAAGGGMGLSEIMEALIHTTVARPSNIEEVTSEWTPFERMGLGAQCAEFLGLQSLGNM